MWQRPQREYRYVGAKALRQHSYVDPAWVEEFVARTDLSGLSERAIRRRREDA